MTCFTRNSATGQRGAVLAEMALVTPILLVLLLATADLTRAFIEHNTLTKAARNGVRHVAAQAFRGTTGVVSVDAILSSETKNLVVYGSISPGMGAQSVLPGLAPADVTVTQIVGTNYVEVSVTHSLGGLFGPVLPISFYSGNTTAATRNLTATVTMRAL